MIKCSPESCEIKGSKVDLVTCASIIFSELIKTGVLSDVEDIFILFEAVSKLLRNDFDESEGE